MNLDPIRRLRVVAAGLHDATLVEVVLDAPYLAIWQLASDLERGLPQFEPSVAAVRVIEREGERLRIMVLTPRGLDVPMTVVLREGYCLMQSDDVVVGMAARAEGAKTRFAHFESLAGRSIPPSALINELHTLETLARASVPRSQGRFFRA